MDLIARCELCSIIKRYTGDDIVTIPCARIFTESLALGCHENAVRAIHRGAINDALCFSTGRPSVLCCVGARASRVSFSCNHRATIIIELLAIKRERNYKNIAIHRRARRNNWNG